MKKLVRRVVAAMLLAVVLYGVLVVVRGLGSIRDALEQFAWSSFAAACGLSFCNYVLRFLKWEFYLARLEIRGVPKLESFLVFLSGFVLTVTPGKVGEVFKSLVLQDLRGVPIARTAPIVVAERVTDLIGVIVMITIGSLSFSGGLVWASAGALLVALLLVIVSSKRASDFMLDLGARLPGALGRAFARAGPKVRESLEGLRVLTTPGALVWPTLLSIAAWSLEGIGLFLILRGFGQSPDLRFVAFVYSTATLAGAVVPVPGGLGVTEKMIDEQLVRLGGVPGSIATAAMLLIRLATLWFAVLVGFVSLALLRGRGDLGRALEGPQPPSPAGSS